MTDSEIILLVDDNPQLLTLLADMLTPAGWQVRACAPDEQALAAAVDASVGLILLPASRPDMDAFETCRKLKAWPASRHIPVIFIGEAGAEERGFELGAQDFLCLPLRAGEVLARVGAQLELVRLRSRLAQAEFASQHAHAVLRQSEARFRIIFEQAAVGVVQTDSHSGQYLAVNQTHCDFFGYTRQEMLQKTYQQITHPDDLQTDLDLIQKLRAGEIRSFSHEKRYFHKNGSIVWILLTVSPMWNPGEEPDYHLSITQDITARKRAEEKLRRQNNYLAALQKTTLELIFERDLHTLLENIVRRAGQLVGTEAGFLDLVEPSSERLMPQVGIGALAEALKYESKPGEGLAGLVWQSAQAQVINDYDAWPGRVERFSMGSIRAIVGVPLLTGQQVLGVLGLAYTPPSEQSFGVEEVELLTQFARLAAIAIENARLFTGLQLELGERKKAEQAQRNIEERLRLAVSASGMGIWSRDFPSGRLDWSRECKIMFGLPAEVEVTDELFYAAIHPADRAPTKELVRAALLCKSTYNTEFRVIWPDGSLHWIAALGQGYYDERGRARHITGVSMDISERKRAEAEIRALNTQLEQRVLERTAQLEAANQELESFSYSVSHDLRAPLRGIDGWSLALQEDYGGQLDEQACLYLDRVRSETQRMGQLIDDLLALSRTTRIQIQPVLVDLSALVEGIVERLREAHSGRELEFIIQPGLTARGDSRLLEIALTNLLGNACKFTGTRPLARIEFGLLPQNGRPVYYVRDNGVGFDMLYARNLFGAFQRMHRQSEFPGSGIGLATVQRIIHRHGGRIWAEAEYDQGAAFYFTLVETL